MKDYRKLNLFITIILICCFCIESITAATLPSVNADELDHDMHNTDENFESIESGIIGDTEIAPIIPPGSLTETDLTRNGPSGDYAYFIDILNDSIVLEQIYTLEQQPIYSGEFNDASYAGDICYVAVNNTIISVTTGGEQTVLYTGNNTISNISAYESIIYFVENGTLYSILPNGESITQITALDNLTDFYCASTTKTIIRVATLNEDVLSYKEYKQNKGNEDIEYFYFLYDSQLNTISQIEEHDYYYTYIVYSVAENDGSYDTDYVDGNFSVVIHGVTLPLSNYPGDGSAYFNTTGINSEAGIDSENDDVEVAGTTGCTAHNDENGEGIFCRTYNGGTQCYGFAEYVFFKTFETYINSSVNGHGPNGHSFQAQITNIPIGAHVRVDDAHSFILLAKGDNTFTVYEANANGNCQVTVSVYTYAEYTSSYEEVTWSNYIGESCEHNFEATSNYDENGHELECTECGITTTENHAYGTPTTYTEHGHVVECVDCGYDSTQEHTIQTQFTSSGHIDYCLHCGYSVTEPHDPVWVKTATKHSKKCSRSGCSVTFSAPESHSFDAVSINNTEHMEVCTICEYGGEVSQHDIIYSHLSGQQTHTKKCSSCDLSVAENHSDFWYDGKNATIHNKVCGVCDGVASTEGHTTFKYTSNGEGSHIKKCKKCNYVLSNNEAHDWESGTWSYPGNLASTCKTRTDTCSLCQQTKTVSQAHPSYSYTGATVTTHTKSCTNTSCSYTKTEAHTITTGSWSYPGNSASVCRKRTDTCSVCKHTIPVTQAHPSYSYSETSTANHQKSCTRSSCNYTKSEAHTVTAGSWQKVSSSSQCRKRYHSCDYCTYGYYTYDNTHSYSLGDVVLIGTYEQCRKQYKDCASCDYGYYEYYNEHDYTYTAWTPTTVGGFDEKRTGTCDICGFTYTFYREKDE